MLFNHNINNLSGGVSQQPVESRFDNQVESIDNFMVTTAQGLRRRNPIDTVAITATAHSGNMAVHSYDRGDGLRKYGMIIDDNGLRVFDETGSQKTVNIVGDSPVAQWMGANWKRDMQFLTVGDTTWILNKQEIITYTQASAGTPDDVAFYWIKKSFDNGGGTAGDGYTYEVVLNGTTYSKNHADSIAAINALEADITAGGYTVKTSGSIMRITRATSFTFESGDSWGNQASVGWMNSVAKIGDLPASMNGFTDSEVGTIAITGTDRDNFTNYYLMWEEDHWTETYKEGFNAIFDKKTLPAKLAQVDENTFNFSFNDEWEDRRKGDEDSNPVPSFIGFSISNMFFFKNRLGFTSEENVILSEAGGYYNFFATTAMEILDSDPIDAGVDSNTVSVIRNVNATAGALTLWADNAQFLLSGGEVLSPATTRISQTSSYDCDNSLSPVVIDNEIIFFNKKGSNLEALSYAPASLQADKSSAESISAHIPTYLPNTIDTVAVSSANNLMFLKDANDNNTLYVYKYHIQGGQKVISAWFKWTIDEEIKAIEVLANTLFILANTNDIFKMDLEPKDIDSNFQDKGTVNYESKVVMSSYNLETRQGTKTIREPFYIKNIKVNTKGKVNLDIINSERLNTKTVNTKHIHRRLVIGGNSEKINVGFSTSYDTGCAIDTISVEGRLQARSRNI